MALDYKDSSFSWAVKTLYPQQRIVKEGIVKHTLLAMLTAKARKNWEGSPAVLGVDYADPAGRSADFSVSFANKNIDGEGDKFLLTSRRDYMHFGLDNETVEACGSNTGALLRAYERQMQGSLRAITNSAGHAVYRDGRGVVSTIATGGISSNTITLADAEDVTYFQKKQIIRLVDPGTGLYRTGTAQITAIKRGRAFGTNPINSTITVDNLAGITGALAGDLIVFPGDLNNKLLGLDAWLPSVVTSTPFLGVDRTKDEEFLAGIKVDATGMQYADAFQLALHAAGRGQGNPNTIMVHGENYANYAIQMGSAVVPTKRPMEVSGVTVGFDGFKIVGPNMEAELFSDYDCPHNVAYALDLDTTRLWHRGPTFIRMNEKDGNRMSRLDGAVDATFGNWFYYANVGMENPGHNVRVALGAS